MIFQQTLNVDWPTFKQNQLELWHYVLGVNVDIGEKFCSPFRSDTRPGCWIEWHGDYIR